MNTARAAVELVRLCGLFRVAGRTNAMGVPVSNRSCRLYGLDRLKRERHDVPVLTTETPLILHREMPIRRYVAHCAGSAVGRSLSFGEYFMNIRNRPDVVIALMLMIVTGCAGVGTDRPAPSLAERPVPHQTLSQDSTRQVGAVRHSAFEADSEDDSLEPLKPLPAQVINRSPSLRQPRTIQAAHSSPTEPAEVFTEPANTELDLTSALAIAGGQSPQIAFAAARYREAYARLESARTLWLPSIRAGMSYHHHDGNLQASDGSIVNVNRSSLQSGLGVNAVGAGTTVVPGLAAQFHTTDAIFQPKIAGHATSARAHGTDAATNDTLLATALAYLNLLRATQTQRIADETRDNAQKLSNLTAQFARSGQGSQADADRAQTELVRRRNDVSRADEATRVASARLAELLRLDPAGPIIPQEPTIVPIELVPTDIQMRELVSTGLSNRPELAEAQHLVCEAVFRYRREKYAPLVPSVLLGVSQSGFGGGVGSTVNDVRRRFDFDAGVFWEVRNLGFGERANRDETTARYDQARAAKTRIMDSVAREVVEAATQVKARKGQIKVAESGVKSANDSYERNLARIREGQGLPIEVLQSLQALDDARHEYLRTLADYNESQFRLQRALGWPIH